MGVPPPPPHSLTGALFKLHLNTRIAGEPSGVQKVEEKILVSIRTKRFYIMMQEGLYQNKAYSSLVFTCNCKRGYSPQKVTNILFFGVALNETTQNKLRN